MADTFSSLNVHCVFSTKNREPLLLGEIKERFWAFMGGIAKQNSFLKKHGIGFEERYLWD
jgi:hypothetical protein